MSVISVIINLDKKNVPLEDIKRLTHFAKHRGNDDENYYVKDNIGLGHGLNKVMESDTSQPFYLNNKIVLLDGEIFEFKDSELSGLSNTTTLHKIVYLYEKYGFEMGKYIYGKFALIILDKEDLFVVRDHFGFKPIYYFKNETHLLITSEIKQIIGYFPQLAQINQTRVFDFLSHGYLDRTNETLFDKIYQIQAGHFSVIKLQNVTINQISYYSVSNNISSSKGVEFSNAKKILEERLYSNTKKMLSDKKLRIGTALSGGLDSSIITAILTQFNSKTPPEALAVCIGVSKLDETIHAEKMAHHLNIKLHKIVPTFSKFQAYIDNFIYHQDEPAGTDSAFALYLFYKEAKALDFKVIFGGVGVDAFLAGYDVYFRIYFKDLWKRHKYVILIKELCGYFWVNGFQHLNYLIKKQKQSSNYHLWLNSNFCESNKPFYLPPTPNILTYAFKHISGDAQIALHYDDRAASSVGIESRFPFYEQDFIALCLGFPDNFKIRKGWKKYILRETFKDLLPHSISHRKDKVGLYNPGYEWMQENKEWFINEITETVNTWHPILNHSLIKHFNHYLESGQCPFNEGIFWRIIFFGRWAKVFNVATPLDKPDI